MSRTFERVIELIRRGQVRISEHGYDELSQDRVAMREILTTVDKATVVEDYPDYHKGPCVLVLQKDHEGRPIHVVWGIPRDALSPAVLVTAYRPMATQWTEDFSRRRS